MEKLPHHYEVKVSANKEAKVLVRVAGLPNLPEIEVAPPKQFGGPGDKWSPEELLMAAVSNCLVLSFQAIAKASKFDWSALEVSATGELNKTDKGVKFTRISSMVTLTIGPDQSEEKAKKLLEKAESTCFISNTLDCERVLECVVQFAS